MKLNLLTSFGFALFTALGAVASPIDFDSNSLDVRDEAIEAGVAEANVFDEANIADEAGEVDVAAEDGEAGTLIRYDGVSALPWSSLQYTMERELTVCFTQICSNRNNQCRYKAQSGRTAICRCQVKRVSDSHPFNLMLLANPSSS